MITPPISIREGTVEDVPFMKAMLWEALLSSPDFLARMGVEKLQQDEDNYWGNWPHNPDPAFMAVDSTGRNLGAITVKPNDTNRPVRSWRLGIGLEAAARGQRIGQLLIERAFEFARAEAAQTVTLFVASTNSRGLGLYRRCGFVEIGEKDGIIEMRVNL